MQYLPVRRNWLLGKKIVEEELGTNRKGNYGKEIIISVSKKLTEEYGKGFERSSVYSFVQFYKEYKDIFQTASGQSFLSWSHYLVLLQVFDKEARDWYESEALREAWSVRTL